MSTVVQPRFGASSPEPLSYLSRVCLAATPPPQMSSLPLQLANSITVLHENLAIRGESSLQHYYAEALTLTCLRPASNDVEPYELLLRGFVQFDRRRPALPPFIKPGTIAVDENHAVYFIQALRDQVAFQPIYEAARQFDRYGAMGRARKKMERIILFARELAGQTLIASASAPEELYGRICASAA